jgi:hypothetical protein
VCGGDFLFRKCLKLLEKLKDMFSKHGSTPNNEPVQRESHGYPPSRQYRQYRADVSGMYEDESDWLYCSIFLRLWFLKCVV